MHGRERGAGTEDPAKVFELIARIGSGSFSDVYSAKVRATGEMAVKVIILDANEQLDGINNEIEILKKCNHPNVVKYFGYYERAGKQAGQKQIWVRSRLCDLSFSLEPPPLSFNSCPASLLVPRATWRRNVGEQPSAVWLQGAGRVRSEQVEGYAGLRVEVSRVPLW